MNVQNNKLKDDNLKEDTSTFNENNNYNNNNGNNHSIYKDISVNSKDKEKKESHFSDLLNGQSYKNELNEKKDFSLNEYVDFDIFDENNKENLEIGFKDVCYRITEMLEKSTISFIKFENGQCKINIKFGNNRVIEYETLLKIMKKNETNFEIEEYKRLYDNFISFVKIIENIKESINNINNNISFQIRLTAVENQDNNNNIKNIKFEYIINDQVRGIIIYGDENVLKNGLGKGFDDFKNLLKNKKSKDLLLLEEYIQNIDISKETQGFYLSLNNNNDYICNLDIIKNIQCNGRKKDFIKQNNEEYIFLKKKIDVGCKPNLKTSFCKHNKKSNLLKNVKQSIKKELLDFINNKIKQEFKDNYKEFLIMDNPYNIFNNKKFKEHKELLTMTIKEIFESEKPWLKNYKHKIDNKKTIDFIYNKDYKKEVIKIFDMTLLEYIKYYREDSSILNNDKISCLSGLDNKYNLLKKKLKNLGYKDEDIEIFIAFIKNIEKSL